MGLKNTLKKMHRCKFFLELFVTNPDGTKSKITQEEVTVSKKTLGIYDAPAGGNEEHLKHITQKAAKILKLFQNLKSVFKAEKVCSNVLEMRRIPRIAHTLKAAVETISLSFFI